ncbi:MULTISPECIES: YqcC family protein [unclassified Halomonas]|uniref:YqcC family protein n=1 Tax=unclassified Halomonas TaxID=2609666 RepID=UPI001C98BE4B|nr:MULTISPECIES: YqcC family protein [unclassified Halomonas]MBY5926256.1 YqcC family protein [Halomonas sp. DP4Y7-2]MBY6233298.1 YqcC family protein [Halomonas sp. DP4Y7-1]
MPTEPTVHEDLAAALRELQATMKAANMWRMDKPEPAAFNSQQPFCIDTMSLPQWLRFVFIARLEVLVDQQAALPASCDVAPAVDAYLIQEGASAQDRVLLRKVVEDIDRLITDN